MRKLVDRFLASSTIRDFSKSILKRMPPGGPAAKLYRAVSMPAAKTPEEEIIELTRAKDTLRDLDTSKRLRLADAYRKVGLIHSELEVLQTIPEEEMKNDLWQRLADTYCEIGHVSEAFEVQDRIQQHGLTANGQRIFTMARHRYLTADSRRAEAAEMLEDLLEQTASPTPGVIISVADDRRTSGDFDGALKLLYRYLPGYLNSEAYNRKIANTLLEINQVSAATLLLTQMRAQFPKSASVKLEFARLMWQIGDFEELERIFEDMVFSKNFNHSFAALASEYGHHFQFARDAAEVFETHIRTSASLVDDNRLIALAKSAENLEQFALAKAIAGRYIKRWNINPEARQIRGTSRYYLGDYTGAERDLRIVIQKSPQRVDPYITLLNILIRQPDGVNRFSELLDLRDKASHRHRSVGPDGRRGLMDVERMQVLHMQGRVSDGMRIKMERPVCRYLEQKYPKQYGHFADGLQGLGATGEKKKSILVIAEDGVGDEIRWAQNYGALRAHYEEIHISTEPRLTSLFQRSFPDFTIHEVPRRWVEMPVRFPDHRTEVPYMQLARLVTPGLFRNFEYFDEIRLATELFASPLASHGFASEAPFGEEGYIRPDPDRMAYWVHELNRRAGGRKKVGLVWRSNLQSARRRRHYMDVRDLKPILREKNAYFVSIQHGLTNEEESWCRMRGIDVFDEIDWQDDFEEIAAFTAALDLLLGTSTLPYELGVATGTPGWLLGTSANLVKYRVGDDDGERCNISVNSRVVRADIEEGFRPTDDAHTQAVVSVAARQLHELGRDLRGAL